MRHNRHQDDPRYSDAIKRVKQKRDFYSNLISWILVSAFLMAINLLTSPSHYWFLYPFLGWGLGVAFHAAQVFGAPGFSERWEERKLREEMERLQGPDEDTLYLDDLDEDLELRERSKEPTRRGWSDEDLV